MGGDRAADAGAGLVRLSARLDDAKDPERDLLRAAGRHRLVADLEGPASA
jgi:hypothetical protein